MPKPTRPIITKPERSPRGNIGVRVMPALRARLQEIANREGVSLSKAAADLLAFAVEQYKPGRK